MSTLKCNSHNLFSYETILPIPRKHFAGDENVIMTYKL